MHKIFKNLFKSSLIIIFTIIYTIPSDGMVKYSFRMRGLGTNLSGFVDDLYSDLFFNPAYIARYKNKYIYTNLSNLQGKGEDSIFGQNNSEINKKGMFPSNLLGIIGGFQRGKFGAFLESSGHSFELTDELGYEDYPTGSLLNTSSSRTFSGDFNSQGITFMGMFRDIGYLVAVDRLGMNVNWSTKNDTVSSEEPALINKRIYEKNGELKFPNSPISFVLGKVYKNEKSETSVSGGFMPQRLGINLNEVFPVLKKPFIEGDDDDFENFDENELGYMELGIQSYFLNIRYKNISTAIDNFHQNSYLFNFTRYNFPIDISVNKEIISDTTAKDLDGNILDHKKGLTTDKVTGSGSAGINSLTFGVGTERYFDGLKSMSAIGIKLQYMSGNFDLDQGPGIRTEEYHQFFNRNDSTTIYENVFSDNKTTVTSGKANLLMLSIPIGLEMKITKKFTFRIGADATIPLFFDGSWKRTISDSTNTLDGQSYIPDDALSATENKVSKLKGKLLNLRSYHFGASYKVSDAINIDFLNFADITNLRTWWLSVVLKL